MNLRNAKLSTTKFVPPGKSSEMAFLSKKFFNVWECLGKLSSFPQFPEITLLFASRNFFEFNGDVWSNKISHKGLVAWRGWNISVSG